MSRVRVAALVAVLAVPLAATGCTAPEPAAHPAATTRPAATPATGSSAGGAATRWWSNGRDRVGSIVDPADHDATTLHRSRAAYCGMLRDATRRGHGVFGPATGNTLLARAFVAELGAVAPAAVASSWRVVGPVFDDLVAHRGTASGAAAAAAGRAASAIARDARAHCALTLSSAGP